MNAIVTTTGITTSLKLLVPVVMVIITNIVLIIVMLGVFIRPLGADIIEWLPAPNPRNEAEEREVGLSDTKMHNCRLMHNWT